MMFTWEWNPVLGANKKPATFEHGGEIWTFARGCRSNHWWFPLIAFIWASLAMLDNIPTFERVMVWLGAAAILVGWYLSIGFQERGWRIAKNGHFEILTHRGIIKDLGMLVSKGLATADYFEQFQSKSFVSLRFPMLRFFAKGKPTGVVGTIPCLFTEGFTIPFTLGFFYSSITLGSFKLKSGHDLCAWVTTETNHRVLLFAYTHESLCSGLDISPTPDSQTPVL